MCGFSLAVISGVAGVISCIVQN